MKIFELFESSNVSDLKQFAADGAKKLPAKIGSRSFRFKAEDKFGATSHIAYEGRVGAAHKDMDPVYGKPVTKHTRLEAAVVTYMRKPYEVTTWFDVDTGAYFPNGHHYITDKKVYLAARLKLKSFENDDIMKGLLTILKKDLDQKNFQDEMDYTYPDFETMLSVAKSLGVHEVDGIVKSIKGKEKAGWTKKQKYIVI